MHILRDERSQGLQNVSILVNPAKVVYATAWIA